MEKTEDGAFGSTLNVIDIATKTVYNPTQFKYKLGKNKDLIFVNGLGTESTIANIFFSHPIITLKELQHQK